MRQIFISFTTIIVSLFSLVSSLVADTQTEYPKLYQSLWPEFCKDHLLNESKACSEQLNGTRNEYYLERISAEDGRKLQFRDGRFWRYTFYVLLNPELINESIDMMTFIPEQERFCSYLFCKTCNQPVRKSLGVSDRFWDHQKLMIQYICQCNCIEKIPEFVDPEMLKYSYWYRLKDASLPSDWYDCKNLSLPFAYFNTFTAKYSQFFNHHLLYSKQNSLCTCYWPYVSKLACQISNIVYDKMEALFQTSCLSNLIYKEGKPLEGNSYSWGSPVLLKHAWCSDEGEKEFLLRTLQNHFIFSFFYSNYHSAIIDLCKYIDTNGKSSDFNKLYSILDSIRPLFLNLYSNCLDDHPHPKIYYERGMVYFHNGDLFSSLSDMKAFMDSVDEDELEELLTSDFYLQEGTSYAELGQYDEAIEALTKSISKDPENKEAYFERAAVYFETGDFDQSIQDYLDSGFNPTPIDLTDLSSIEFSKHLIFGIVRGSGEAVTDFIPSVLASANGLSHGLWAFACDPVNCSKEMVDSCKGMLEFLSSSSGIEMLETFIPEIKDFNNAQSSEEKAALLGFMIGKYGTEIFAPAGALKVYKNLKSANRLLTLQNLSKASKEATVVKEVATNWNKAHLESIDQFKKVESTLKAYKGQFFTETTARKILHEAGFKTFHKPKGLPDNFRVQLADKGGGMKYIHPDHTYESVRVMPGKPHSPNVNQQKPYITHHTKDGLAYDKYGNKVSQGSIEAHIPLEEFVYRPDVT